MRDLRYAFRTLLTHRWFSAAIVLTLALGIGLNTMVFALVNAVLFRPLSIPGGERLVTINLRERNNPGDESQVSLPDLRDYRASATAFETIEAAAGDEAVLAENDHAPQSYRMNRITPGLFAMLRTPPVLGRPFGTADGAAGAAPVVLIGYSVWKDRYGLAPSVIGRVVRVNEKPTTIVGVMPEDFRFPQSQDVWIPLVPTKELEDRSSRGLQLFAYLKPGVTREQATANLSSVSNRLSAQYPDADKNLAAFVQTFHERYNGGNIQIVFFSLLGAVGLVLMIACANVANMLLGRALGRQREISIRFALGASRRQIVQQLLLESVILSSLGGVAGLGFAAFGVHAFDLATRDVGKPYWILFQMDWQAFGYCAVMCIVSGMLFGLAPALRATRVDLNSTLKDGTRAAGSRHGGYLTGALVIGQFALTLVLLSGAGLFVRSFFDALSLNPTIPSAQILSARFHLPRSRYKEIDSRVRFAEQADAKLRALPGVSHVAIESDLPEMGAMGRPIEIDGRQDEPKHRPGAAFLVLVPGFFSTINLPLQQGRDFAVDDGDKGKETAIVTRDFASKFWPKEGALGKRFRTYLDDNKPGPWLTVIGVSSDLVQEPQSGNPRPLAFLPDRLEGNYWMALMVRTSGNPESLAGAVRGVIQSLDADLPLSEVRTLADGIHRNQWYLRVFGTLFGTFAVIGLVMASVGIYAVIAQATGSRTQEIGVRMALGATSGSILALILRRGIWQLAIAIAIGLAAAVPAVKVMSRVGMRVSATDPLAFGAVVALLGAVGLFACWLPARRAAALDPVKAIRYE
jgi:predicted permease